MASQTLASFIIKLRHQIDPGAAQQFTATVGGSIKQVNEFRLALLALAVGAEEAIRRTNNNIAGLYYLNRATGVAAAGIMDLRAKFVGAGMDAQAADAAIGSFAKALRDPGTVGQVQALIGRPIANAKDGIETLARMYNQAVKESGGKEWEGAALRMRTLMESIDGLDFEGVRTLSLNIDMADKNSAKLNATLQRIGFKGGLEAAGKTAAELNNTFWRLGQTFEFAFAKVLTSPAVADAIDKIAEGIAKWIIDEDNQRRLDHFLDSFAKFIANKDNLDRLVTSMEQLGDALGKIISVGEWMLRHPEIAGALFGAAVGARFGGAYGAAAGAVAGATAGSVLGQDAAGAAWNQGLLDWQREKALGNDKRSFDEFRADFKKWHPEAKAYQHGGIVPAMLHSGEMVLPQNISLGLQSLYSGGGEGGIKRLSEDFDNWWAGDSAFRPNVDLAEASFDNLRQVLMEFFYPDPDKNQGGAGAGAGGGPGGGGGGGAGGGRRSGAGVSIGQMKQLALDAGFTAAEAPIIAATLMHESSGNPYAHGKAGELGIAQVHPAAWGQDLANQSFGNAVRSMQIARMIYLKQGFNAWSSYKHGHYRQFLEAAQAAKPEAYTPGGGPGSADMDPMAPAGSGVRAGNLVTIKTRNGVNVRVAAEFAENFRGFLSDYEKAGGVVGPDTGGAGGRPGNPSYHPDARAIDVNQTGYGIRSQRGKTLPQAVEDALAFKWAISRCATPRKPAPPWSECGRRKRPSPLRPSRAR
jgi:hypothetical protein